MWICCHWASCVIRCPCFSSSTAHCSPYCRVSLKVAAFHEPDDSQGPKKRPRKVLPVNLEAEIEKPSLQGVPAGDLGQGYTPIENPFSKPNSQQTPRTHQAKTPSTSGTTQPATTSLLTPRTISNGKMRSAREHIEATMLRKMVKIPPTPCRYI